MTKLYLSALLLCMCQFISAQDSVLSGRFHFRDLAIEERFFLEENPELQEGNFHSSVWPYRTDQLQFSLENRRQEMASKSRIGRPNNSTGWRNWLSNKFFWDDLIKVRDSNYALNINPVFVLEASHDRAHSTGQLFQNTRGIKAEGQIGKQFSFVTTFLESQGRFTPYYQGFVEESQSALGWAPWRRFQTDAYDFPMATGMISYTPSKYFNFSAGHGNHHFGEGYRSMFLSDHTLPYAHFKIETTFWKIKYVNLYAAMNDINPTFMQNGVFAKKYVSAHYLSWNVTKRWNINVYEALVWAGDSGFNQGFDLNFLNPVIFYRPLEGMRGFRGGNILLGAGTSYRLWKNTKVYGQFVLDDFQLAAFRQYSDGHWLNFYAAQIGVKQPKAFGVDGLFLLGEFNWARPFTYAHRSSLTNYAHHNYALAHPWGANFRELVIMANYTYGRWVFHFRMSAGERGVDEGPNNGSDINRSYSDRDGNTGYYTARGSYNQIINGQAKVSYIINASTGARVEAGLLMRRAERFRQVDNSPIWLDLPASMITFGINTPIFNRYNDL